MENIDEEYKAEKEFLNQLETLLKDIKGKRRGRKAPAPGYHYKRDVIDRMADDNELKVPFLISEYRLILKKESNLPAQKINFVKAIVNEAIRKSKKNEKHLKRVK